MCPRSRASSRQPEIAVRVLAIDTALGLCSAAVTDGDAVLASCTEAMQQGHQERLAPMVAEVMTESGLDFDDLARIAVTVGPGSFTGLRVGLSFAKGVGFARDIPVLGFDSLEAIAASAPREGRGLVIVDARRGQVYARRFDGKNPTGPSQAVRIDDLGVGTMVDWVDGPGSVLAAGLFPNARIEARAASDPAALARLAMAADAGDHLPEPIYLRAPDAKLPGGIDP